MNYDDVDGLAKLLESNNVHTVISAIQVMGPEPGAAEVNLVHAASMSSPTKRFIASDWGIPFPDAYVHLRTLISFIRSILESECKSDVLTRSNIQQRANHPTPHTRRHNGRAARDESRVDDGSQWIHR